MGAAGVGARGRCVRGRPSGRVRQEQGWPPVETSLAIDWKVEVRNGPQGAGRRLGETGVADAPKRNAEALKSLYEKALKDEAFRRRLMADPKGTIEQELGTKLRDGVKVYVHEETADTFHLVLPHLPSKNRELSEAELAAVAGGGWGDYYTRCLLSEIMNC